MKADMPAAATEIEYPRRARSAFGQSRQMIEILAGGMHRAGDIGGGARPELRGDQSGMVLCRHQTVSFCDSRTIRTNYPGTR